MKRRSWLLLVTILTLAQPVPAQQVDVEEYILPNGMKLLMVPRKGDPNVAAGWVAKVGSVNERPGITGLSHLFEHMMFKGTRTIGTKDIEADLRVLARIDAVRAEIAREEREQIRRLRFGEITDLKDRASRTPRHNQLLEEMARLEKEAKGLLVSNEFDKIYTAAGASGMNAGTGHDYTIYYINVPANKLELWFWMESDRLLNPVFREFYAERDVVYEERRLRVESTPTGKFEEEFDAMFWSSSPYSWPVVGWPSDLDGITREEARAYYDLYYAPNNLAACLVGDFDPAQAKALADRYFGRLRRSPVEPPPVRTREITQLAEKRLKAYAETNPSVEIRHHSVADGHADEPALVVAGALLSGRTGRLYRSLVLDAKVASNASAGQDGRKWEGMFAIGGVARPGKTPEDLEEALYRELDRLKSEKVSERELQKVKNRFAADMFRRVENNFGLMLQLLQTESFRGWRTFNEDPKKIAAVTAEDVARVAGKYFQPENRTLALYYTKKESTSDPLLEGLTEQERAEVRQIRSMLPQMNVESARRMLAAVEEQQRTAAESRRRLLDTLKKLLTEKVERGGKP